MTFDLQAEPAEQVSLWELFQSQVPALASVRRFWLEPGGARCAVLNSTIEIDLALSTEAGALVVEFEAAREKASFLPGTHKLPGAAWRWQVRRIVEQAQPRLPVGVTLDLDGEARLLRVRVSGLRFVRALVNAERLILECEPDA